MKFLQACLLFFFLGFGALFSQELRVKNITLLPNDDSAIRDFCLDNNGDTCALVKIKTSGIDGLEFTNNSQYVRTLYKEGVYYVYLPIITGRRISYQHEKYLPGQIDLSEYGYRKLKAGKTYLVQMDAQASNLDNGFIIVKVEPLGTKLWCNGEQLGIATTGIYEIPAQQGKYELLAEKEDYQTLKENISIEKGERKNVALTLSPIMHNVEIKCNVDNALIFVDNINYGTSGKLGLPQGSHRIRVQKEGYIDFVEDVNISDETKVLTFQLMNNRNVKEIHPTPVRIYSNANKVYKNNKEIKDWKNSGDEILIMPGKYLLADDIGHMKEIEVGEKPLNISLDGVNSTNYYNDTDEKHPIEHSKMETDDHNNNDNQMTTDVELLSNVDGADIYIDDIIVGVTPFRGRVSCGQHNIILRVNGYQPAGKELLVQGNHIKFIFTLYENKQFRYKSKFQRK